MGPNASVQFQLQVLDEGSWQDFGDPGDYRSRHVERRWHQRAGFAKWRIVALV